MDRFKVHARDAYHLHWQFNFSLIVSNHLLHVVTQLNGLFYEIVELDHLDSLLERIDPELVSVA